MAGCHSADVAKRCPQPWCHLQGLSIVPLSQRLQGVLDRDKEPQRPDSHPIVPYFGFSHWCWETQISTSLCHHRSLCEHLAWQDRGSLLHFLLGSFTFCHSVRPWCHSMRLVPCWPLVPVSPQLHSITNSCCSTLNFHFSFTKIKKKQAHDQAESSQNFRWDALRRAEARQTVFQWLIAFSECISTLY